MNSFRRMLLANFVTVAGCTMFVVLPAYFEASGLQRSQIGLADGCFWCVSLLLQPLLGPKLDRYGPKPFLLLATLLMASMAGLYALVPVHPAGVMLMRACQGAGFSAYLTSSWTWVASNVDPERKGEFFGYFGITSLLGGIVGPVVAEVVDENYRAAFVAAGVSLACGMLLLATLSNRSQETTEGHGEGGLGDFFRLVGRPEVRSTAWGALGFGLAVGSLFAFVVAYIKQLGIHGIAVTFAFITLASGVARIWTGRQMDRHGPARMILPSLILLGLGCLGLGTLPRVGGLAFALLCVSGLAAGLGYGAVHPALNALAVERLPEDAKGRGLSLVTCSIDLGTTTGAAVSGFIAQKLGYPEMFYCVGCATLVIGALFWRAEKLAQANMVSR